jgi:uncharacterized protein (TIGR00369 family)
LSDLLAKGWLPIEDESFMATLGQAFQRSAGESIETAIQTDSRHQNLAGTVHGGVIMTLVDRAIGINCRRVRADSPSATLTTTINFQRPARTGSLLIATCRIRKSGRTMIFAEADVTADDALIASASAIFVAS